MGLPILSIDPHKSTPFVAVEFDTYQNLGWDPPSITPGTHGLLPELVTIGFSAATRGLYEKHTVKSWSFNSSFQIGVPGNPSPSTNPSPTAKSNPSTSPSPSPSPSTNPSPTAKSSPSTNSSPSPNAVNSGIGKKMSGGIDYQIIFFGWLVGFAWLYIVGK